MESYLPEPWQSIMRRPAEDSDRDAACRSLQTLGKVRDAEPEALPVSQGQLLEVFQRNVLASNSSAVGTWKPLASAS
jgi:hypothetical protein